MAAPVPAQGVERGSCQGNEAVFGALAAMDMDHHATGVDIGDFQIQRLLQAQAAGIHRAQVGAVVRGANATEQCAHLFAAQYRRQP